MTTLIYFHCESLCILKSKTPWRFQTLSSQHLVRDRPEIPSTLMAKTETFQLVSTATATSVGVTYFDVPYSGTIVCVGLDITGLAGAGTNTRISLALTKNAVDTSTATNSRGEIACMGARAEISAGGIGSTTVVPGIAYPVKAGERLYLSVTISGTTPSALQSRIQIHLAS